MFFANARPINITIDIQRHFRPTLLTVPTYEDIEGHLMAKFSVKKSLIGAEVQFVTNNKCQVRPLKRIL